MKKWMLLMLCTLLAPLAGAAGPTMGQHGMALFGGADGLYAAHLPMFHAPHDYQVVLKIRLADAALDASVRHALQAKVALWTLAPEQFELDRLAPHHAHPLQRFGSDIVQGHFEQGGKTRHAGADVIVERVLVFRKLSPGSRDTDAARYLQVGSGATRFLVKEVDSRPDFDHIVAVRAPANAPQAPLVLPKTALLAPAAAAFSTALPGAKVRGTVYFSTEDLK